MYNLKEIVDLIATNKVLLHYWKGIFYLQVAYIILSVHCHSCCLYKQYHRGVRGFLHVIIDILFYIVFYITNTMTKQTFLYHVRTYDVKKVPI